MAMKRKFMMYAPGNRNYGYCRLHFGYLCIGVVIGHLYGSWCVAKFKIPSHPVGLGLHVLHLGEAILPTPHELTSQPSSFVHARVKYLRSLSTLCSIWRIVIKMPRPISKLMIQEGSSHNVQYNSSIYYLNQW